MSGDEESTLHDIVPDEHNVIPDYSTTGASPEIESLLNQAKQLLSPIDRMILDYRILGYKNSDIANMFATQEVKTPRGGIYDKHDISIRYNTVIKPILEQVIPEEIRKPFQQKQEPNHWQGAPPPYEPVYPSYRVNPETGEKTLIEPVNAPQSALTEEEKAYAGRLSLKKRATQVLDVLDFIRIALLS